MVTGLGVDGWGTGDPLPGTCLVCPRVGWDPLGMARRRLVVAASGGLLLVGTVLVFLAFDRGSHSASDTLRPFLITMGPVWLVGVLAARQVWSGSTDT